MEYRSINKNKRQVVIEKYADISFLNMLTNVNIYIFIRQRQRVCSFCS